MHVFNLIEEMGYSDILRWQACYVIIMYSIVNFNMYNTTTIVPSYAKQMCSETDAKIFSKVKKKKILKL